MEECVSTALPFVSIVVCSYNGADVLPGALSAIQAQIYDGQLEVIVVDDGSSDDTSDIAKSFKDVIVVRNEPNQGLAGARNVGIQAAHGDVVAFTDDDCRPEPTWISELAAAYEDESVCGVGGEATSNDSQTITLRYLRESRPLAPLERSLAASNKLTYRLGLYVKGLLGLTKRPANTKRRVYSLVGANMSFRKKALQEVGGFDDRFRFGAEEEDLCKRIYALHPDGLVYAPEAKIIHHFEPSLRDTLRRSSAYGKGNARMFHKHANVKPIIYPFPVLVSLLPLLGLLNPWLALTPLAVIPFIYAKWLGVAWKQRTIEAVLYGYIQWLQEWRGNAGFMKGLWQYRHMFKTPKAGDEAAAAEAPAADETDEAPITAEPVAPAAPQPPKTSLTIGSLLPPVLLVAGLIAAHAYQLAYLYLPLAIAMVLVSGHLLLRCFGLRSQRLVARWALSVPLGLAWTMLTGLLAATLLPRLDIARPLDFAPAAVTYSVSLALLYAVSRWRKAKAPALKPERTTLLGWLLYSVAALLPVLSFAGATILNNGGANTVTIAMFITAIALFAVTLARSKTLPSSVLPVVLFSLSLSALLTYSLRSAFVFGWDIQQEYDVFQATQQHGTWLIGAQHTPYSAMLSLTTLPTLLSNIAGVPAAAVFKLFYPMLFSVLPVILYYGYRMYARRWISFVAAALTIAQFHYLQEFSALARQQIAFLFFAAILYVLLQERFSLRARRWFIGSAIIGLVLSHYSTAYVAIVLLGLMWLITKIVMFFRRDQLTGIIKNEGYVEWWMVALLLAGVVFWYGPATHSSAALRLAVKHHNYSQVASQSIDMAVDTLAPQTGSVKNSNEYLGTVGDTYRHDRPYFDYYADANNKTIHAVQEPTIAHRAVAYSAGHLLDVATRIGWWVLGLIGIAIMAVRIIGRRNQRQLEIGVLLGAAVLLFVAIHLIPNVGKYYNVPRMNQQLLMLAALPAVLTAAAVLRGFPGYLRKTAIGSAFIISFVAATGLLTQFTGGTPSANLNNFGTDYHRFYIHQTDAAAATWLGSVYDNNSAIFIDRYAALRLTVPTSLDNRLMNDVTPETIARGSYVFGDYKNVVNGVTMVDVNGRVVVFQFPKAFLDSHKDLLYSNGKAVVYK
jgi:uncharacterized membrane protein/glycosyltransferase involved in cell wall biosynthesis